MRSYTFCPVSDKKINERVARLNASFTVLLLIAFGVSQNILPIIFLCIDFLFRATEYSRYSLISISSKKVIKYFSFNEVFINAGPKIFAARIGLVLSTLVILMSILDFSVVSYTIAGTLALFSFLEGAFGYCVACEIYPYVYKLFYAQNKTAL